MGHCVGNMECPYCGNTFVFTGPGMSAAYKHIRYHHSELELSHDEAFAEVAGMKDGAMTGTNSYNGWRSQ